MHKTGAIQGPRLMFRTFGWKHFKSFIFFSIGSQIALGSLIFISVLIASYLQNKLISSSGSWILDYVPLSWKDVNQAIAWILSINVVWTALICWNHWNDLSVIFAQMTDGSLPSLFGAIISFWYVSVWDMGYEFFKILFSDPKMIFTTKAVEEICLGYINCLNLVSISYEWLIGSLPTTMSNLVIKIGTFISGYWNSGIYYICGLLKGSWIWLVSGISATITPTVPALLQPAVDSIISPISKMIAISIVLWILRIFFGYPF